MPTKVAVTYVTGAGSFTDADASTVSFVRTGNVGSMANVVEDNSPQLGASLDVQGHGLTSSSSIMHPSLSSTGKALVLGF